jgi:hypothetical protein
MYILISMGLLYHIDNIYYKSSYIEIIKKTPYYLKKLNKKNNTNFTYSASIIYKNIKNEDYNVLLKEFIEKLNENGLELAEELIKEKREEFNINNNNKKE